MRVQVQTHRLAINGAALNALGAQIHCVCAVGAESKIRF